MKAVYIRIDIYSYISVSSLMQLQRVKIKNFVVHKITLPSQFLQYINDSIIKKMYKNEYKHFNISK